jgi:Crp-like helix-turn-helix domain
MSGTTVETTIRVMSRWLKKGIVSEEDGRLVLPSLEALREIEERGAL